MDYDDVLANLSINGYVNETIGDDYVSVVRSLHLPFLMIRLLSVCANALIISVICRYKTMKTPTNTYILNFAILDILYRGPFHLLGMFNSVVVWICITYCLEFVYQSACIILLLAFLFNWATKPEVYMYVLVMAWLVTVANVALTVRSCSNISAYILPSYFVLLGFLVLMLTCGVKWAMCCMRKNHYDDVYKFRLKLVTVHIAVWFFSWLTFLASEFTSGNDRTILLYITSIISTGVGLGHASLQAVALSLLDKRFKMYLMQTIKCKSSTYAEARYEGLIISANT